MTALSVLVSLCAFLSIQLVFEKRLRLLPWLSEQLNHSIRLQSAVVHKASMLMPGQLNSEYVCSLSRTRDQGSCCCPQLDKAQLLASFCKKALPLPDFFWAKGHDGTGLNHLGRLLMQVRKELLWQQIQVSPTPLPQMVGQT